MRQYTIAKTLKIDGVKYLAGDQVSEDEIPVGNLESMLRLGQIVESSSPAAQLIDASEIEQRDAEIERLREKLAEHERDADEAAQLDPALRDRGSAAAEISKLRGQLAALTAIKAPEPAIPEKPAQEGEAKPPEPPAAILATPSIANQLVGPPAEPPAMPAESPSASAEAKPKSAEPKPGKPKK